MRGFSRATLVLFSILFISDELQKYSKVDAYRAWAQKYTKSSTGCSCWFDLSRGLNCACCQNKGIQCGFPLHKYCQRDARRPQFRKGCPGIKNKDYTLSEKGHPCLDNPSDKSCGWCALDSQQCNTWNTINNGNKCGYLSTYAPGSRSKAWKYCVGRVQDCRIPPSYCDVNAKCVSTGRKLKGSFGKVAYRCACKKGFIGNGITCVDVRSGELGVNEDMIIDMHMELGRTIRIDRREPNFPIGKATGQFERKLENLQAAGDGKEVFCRGNSTYI